MKCPNCILGDLHLLLQGELRFRTDERGRPFGTAEVSAGGGHSSLTCDTCSAAFEVQGWRDDGAGEVILSVQDAPAGDAEVGVEHE